MYAVMFDCADPSVAQESHDAVSPSRHEDSDFGIEKPLENVVPAVSVVASRVCLATNDVPKVSRVEPHVAEVSKDVAVDQTIVNPENADVATEGQSSEVVVDSSQPMQENILLSSKEQQPEDSDTKARDFFKQCSLMFFSFMLFNYYGICIRCLMISET